MNGYMYDKICEDVNAGIDHMILNVEKNETGIVHMCNHGYFNVRIGHGEEVWPVESCEEVDVEKTRLTGLLCTLSHKTISLEEREHHH